MNTIRQTIYLEEDLKEKVRYLSYKENIKQNDIIKEALREYLKGRLTDNDTKQIIKLK